MSLSAGARLGPYEILGLLRAGGMGEVYRAFDPRLGREVAVKVLPEEVGSDPQRLARFEREARAVAALNHPNILTVFDVSSHAVPGASTPGIPFVVTELLEGETLREVSRRAPTPRRVLSFAVQVAHGLDAAHAKGIVHRDLKPENVFVTTDGRVKLLDFGLAKVVDPRDANSVEPTALSPTDAGQVVGTVGYMSPEQVRGLPVDARTDVFSLGVVLYELLAGKHPFRRETAVATLTSILEETPAELVSVGRGIPPTLSGIVRRCLEKERGERYASAHDVGVALEAVLQAPAGSALLREVEERSPYPGLQSFTEKDASVFFGREAEVATLWQKLHTRKLLAVIGPSGAGKTSFLRAGVIPARPEGWSAVCATPGARPAFGFARALTPELAGDAEAMGELLGGVAELIESGESGRVVSAVRRWRSRHGEALLVLDQFEELFTLSTKETQARFAALVGRLVSEADVHVVLSLRDDFLMPCHEQAALAPIFKELTPLGALTAEGLRRALVEPAKKVGYAFENDSLVGEMLSSGEEARGALPLLAFAMARLWERRDREKKLLTREAYADIGGVAGALALHAEATMDKIGPERQAIAREIFRNLITAQGTRAVADREELLSVFAQSANAEEVLRQLVDARLLTSYEVEGAEGQPSHHRVEVVHESLLKAWPRLVRWQAQDEEGAVLRDQLKQAAHLWEEKGRTSDLLWTGTAFREFELWRERYAGALTALEEDFARAMADKARRRRRLLTAAVSSVIVALAGITIAIGVSRQQTARARDQANVEALRAEAGKLLALGRVELDRYPTAALAYARKSLELADTPEARRFALEVLWRGPVARILPRGFEYLALSPDGRWLASQAAGGRLLLVPRDGGAPRTLSAPPESYVLPLLGFGPRSDVLATSGAGQSVRFLSVPDLREIGSVDLGGISSRGSVIGDKVVTFTRMPRREEGPLIRVWPLSGAGPRTLANVELSGGFAVDTGWTRLAYARGREIFLRRLDSSRPTGERLLGRARDALVHLAFVGEGERLVSTDTSGEVRLWSLDRGAAARVLGVSEGSLSLIVDSRGRHVAVVGLNAGAEVWDLRDPPDAEPAHLKTSDLATTAEAAFDANGPWLVTNFSGSMHFWPLSSPSVRRLRGKNLTWTLAFSPDSRWLASCADKNVRLWPLDPANGDLHTLLPSPQGCLGLAAHPAGTHVLVGTFGGEVLLDPVAEGAPRSLLTGWAGRDFLWTLVMAFDAKGRRAVACPNDQNPSIRDPAFRVLRVWDLESGQAQTYSLAHLTDSSWVGFTSIRFAEDGSLYASGQGGVFRLTLPSHPEGSVSIETLYKAAVASFDLSPDGRRLLVTATQSTLSGAHPELLVFDLAAGTSRRITTHGQRPSRTVFDATGNYIVTGDLEGVVRIGPMTGEEPHLLLGDMGPVQAVAVSPDGRWIGAADGAGVRLWPMPDMTEPPLHTLPHAGLMAKLDALTNLRVVRDPASSTAWKLEVGPFQGWKDVPTW
jgi:WD40 repeat protein